MSSYTFPLDTLFDHKPNSDLCFSQFFDSSHSSEVPQFGAKHEDDEMHSEFCFEKMFESFEYRDEGLADVVMGSICSKGLEENVCRTEFEDPIMNQNAGKSVSYMLRRACSTGDLLDFEPRHVLQSQKSLSEELRPQLEELADTRRTRRYTVEQRRMSIDKYKAKRSLRNFNKTIKYECRKTLADNRPRIRGRFKRNEDTSDVTKSGQEDVIWMERFHAMSCEEAVIFRGHVPSEYGWNQFEYASSFS